MFTELCQSPHKSPPPHENNRPSISIIRASPATLPFSISFQSPHVSTFISVLYKTLLVDASVLTRTRLPFCAPRSLATAYKEKPRTERVCSSITRCADQSDLWVLLKLCFFLFTYIRIHLIIDYYNVCHVVCVPKCVYVFCMREIRF